MEQPKGVIKEEFDRSGRYEPGLKSLVRGLQLTFAFLLVVIIGLLVYFFTAGGYFTVDPQHAVIVMRFGKIEETYTTGSRWKFPYPVHRWVTVTTNQQSLMVDFLPAETFDGMPPQALSPGRDSYLLTADANIIHSSWTLRYSIPYPETYYTTLATPSNPSLRDQNEVDSYGFTGTRGPQTLIRNLFRQAVIDVTASRTVNELLYSEQEKYAADVEKAFNELMIAADCGVKVESVTLERVFPPLNTKAAFDRVAAANSTSDSAISQARQYAVQTANSALAEQNALISSAKTYKTTVVSDIEAQSLYFAAIQNEYKKSARPETVLTGLYNNMLAEVFLSVDDIFILGTSPGRKMVRILLNPEPNRRTADADLEDN